MFKMETELESSAEIDEFILGWKNPKFQLPSIFNEMLKQKELIDVTLSAEGRLFGAHRLVLSAFSPYFRQLLTPIPIDQKAYVVLDNVSSSILEDLITFMYCGEVYVRRENLGELLKTGQLLKIKGLADVKYSYNESKTMPDKGSQLKSRTKIETNDPMEVPTTSADISKIEEPKTSPLSDFSGNSNDLKSKFFEINNNIRDGVGNDISNANAQSMVRRLHNKHWQAKRTMTAIHDPRLVTDSGPPKKLLKFTNDSPPTHTIMANIQTNEFGRENLFYKGFKFYRQVTGSNKVRWICMKHSNKRCRAAMSTMVVNSITMMKVLNDQHCHDA